MLTLVDIKNWLKGQMDIGDGIEAGSVNEDKERFIGVLDRNEPQGGQTSIGGAGCTLVKEKAVTVLVHWTKSTLQAEQKAMELLKLLRGLSCVRMGDTLVYYVDVSDGTRPAGCSVRGIKEYALRMVFHYGEDEENA